MPPRRRVPPVTTVSLSEDRETIDMDIVDSDPDVSCYTYPFEFPLIVTSGRTLDARQRVQQWCISDLPASNLSSSPAWCRHSCSRLPSSLLPPPSQHMRTTHNKGIRWWGRSRLRRRWRRHPQCLRWSPRQSSVAGQSDSSIWAAPSLVWPGCLERKWLRFVEGRRRGTNNDQTVEVPSRRQD
jgi:hypothetical protein